MQDILQKNIQNFEQIFKRYFFAGEFLRLGQQFAEVSACASSNSGAGREQRQIQR